ncbi:unnamed protein product [Didymodactylos carnosus]|uniref:AAA+ ATPase domain-containing protein n=1 Tax=Didymodactylos carnosus TaxID=1234261 RepID=A0A813WLB6_9BILA|nr:unnamed protein product [Didymodactylos carnosus]CAF3644350.1 unnamed protein product [Didymodactylos carnosus]
MDVIPTSSPSDLISTTTSQSFVPFINRLKTFLTLRAYSPQATNVPRLIDVVRTSTPDVPDSHLRDLLISLGGRACALLGSMIFSYYLIRYITKHLDPTHEEKKRHKQLASLIMKQLNLEKTLIQSLNEYELCLLSDIVNPHDIQVTWQDIGGLEQTIDNLRQTVIYPLQHPHLFAKSKLLMPPRGVLFYGPPGCGKTMLAKAVAKEAGANFINLQVTSLLDKWYGESQKRTSAIFSLAQKLQPSIIFIDEIDSFMRTRQGDDHECTRMVKTQFMTLWDGLQTDETNRIIIIGATNRPQDLDAAILRRLPTRYNIALPTAQQRLKILELILKDEHLNSDVDLHELAKQTELLNGSDLNEICRQAALERVIELCQQHEQFEEQDTPLRPICQEDFLDALRKVRTGNQAHSLLTLD